MARGRCRVVARCRRLSPLLADQTRDSVRTNRHGAGGHQYWSGVRAGAGAGAAAQRRRGLAGLFAITSGLTLAGIAVVLWLVPPEPARSARPVTTGRRCGATLGCCA